jgi:Na+-translocating ferredoxin:NAD+ oxidoreductase subunit C
VLNLIKKRKKVLKTFTRGGIHPPEDKLSAHTSIQSLPIPSMVIIPISQHLGAPAKIIVNKGDMVKTGQPIARGDGFISSSIHASVSGKVVDIDNVTDVSGYRNPAVFIEVSGDEWMESIIRDETLDRVIQLSGEEILAKIAESGIVGLGGATFPTQVKLTIPPGKKVDALVINGAECEPYLTSDHRLMLERGEEILVGIELLKRALNVKTAYLGIENNKPDAIQLLRKLAITYKGIEVHALKVKYPQGGEKQLIKAILNREVPSGGLPVDVGAVVFNVGTVFAVYEAVQKNKPLFERVITITGKSIRQAANYRVRIGTPVSWIIQSAGGLPPDTGKIICGGPMMGKALINADVPIVKGASGILILPVRESTRRKVQPCVRCARCVSVCCMGLQPYLLMPLSEQQNYDRLEAEHIMDCMECGSCSYECPANRPLLDYIRLGKIQVGKIIRSRKK